MIENQSDPRFHYGWDEVVGFDWKKVANNTTRKTGGQL